MRSATAPEIIVAIAMAKTLGIIKRHKLVFLNRDD